jgi:hypothetical protein
MAEIRQRKYLAKDFESFRNILLQYARTYYGDRISDFSESSVGGLFLDLSSYVGDVLSLYLDHQFNELNIDTAVESENIQRIINSNGFKIPGNTPATVNCRFFIRVPSKIVNNTNIPDPDTLPIIKAGTQVSTNSGITFRLLQDIDFSESQNLNQTIGRTQNGTPVDYILSKTGICISGQTTVDTFKFEEFEAFRKVVLTNTNVHQIISVVDSNGNDYYEVSTLTDDVVFQNAKNNGTDADTVKEIIKIIPAPYRFITTVDINTKATTLMFGGGNAEDFEDDIIPDPSEYAISFPNTTTFSKISVNPNNLLNSKTLGISESNVTVDITYSYGGGLSHNVAPNTIVNIQILNLFFKNNISQTVANNIRSSIEVINEEYAKGGEDAPSIAELRSLVPQLSNSQNRIVTKEDLLARIYTMPSNFGRVFRAGVSRNQEDINILKLFVVSRDSNGILTNSPETLKKNIIKFLEPYRLISDMIEISDATIINFKVIFQVTVDQKFNKETVKQNCINEIIKYFDIRKSNINQEINTDEIRSILYNIKGVISVPQIDFINRRNVEEGRQYSSFSFNFQKDSKNLITPPDGGIFELKFKNFDIIGFAT